MCNDGFIVMLESEMEREVGPAALPCFHLTNRKGSVLLKVQVEGDKIFKDDLTGQLLNPVLV